MKSNWKQYKESLPLAKRIYNELHGNPKTHEEWAESFNVVGSINEILLDEKGRF